MSGFHWLSNGGADGLISYEEFIPVCFQVRMRV